MSSIFKDWQGIFKATGSFVGSVFGWEQAKKRDDVQDVMNSANDLCETFGLQHIFQTEKDKKKAEEAAKAKERADVASIAESLKEIRDIFKSKNSGGRSI